MMAEIGTYVLRDLLPWDAQQVFDRITSNADVMRYMGFRRHSAVAETAKLIEQYHNSPSQWRAVCPNSDTSEIFGIVGFEVQRHQATITIIFRSDWRARGAGRAFSAPFVQWIMSHERIWRVWAYCHVDNIAVQRVLERIGAEREGRLRRFEVFPNISDEPQDCYVYSIVRGANQQTGEPRK